MMNTCEKMKVIAKNYTTKRERIFSLKSCIESIARPMASKNTF